MRPVNLIPPEERRGDHAPSRTGALAYVVVGVLVVALLAVVGVVLTNNQISDRKAKVADLNSQVTQATAEAHRLQSYADFATMESARDQTVSNLARSRFDWYRVLRELALVIPDDVWLTDLQGSVTPDAAATSSSSTISLSSSSAATSEVAGSITGPSLEITGCAAGHDSVARFLGALRDIDGVTRVVVTQSARSETPGQASSSTGPGCDIRSFLAEFEVVVAFDKVPLNPATGLPGSPTPAPTSTPTSTTPTTSTTSTETAGVGAGVRHDQAKTSKSAQQQSAKAHQAISVIPGTVRP